MQAELFGDTETLARILETDDPETIKALGRVVANFSPSQWSAASYDAVLQVRDRLKWIVLGDPPLLNLTRLYSCSPSYTGNKGTLNHSQHDGRPGNPARHVSRVATLPPGPVPTMAGSGPRPYPIPSPLNPGPIPYPPEPRPYPIPSPLNPSPIPYPPPWPHIYHGRERPGALSHTLPPEPRPYPIPPPLNPGPLPYPPP